MRKDTWKPAMNLRGPVLAVGLSCLAFAISHQLGNGSLCTSFSNGLGPVQYNATVGHLVTLRCPVEFCSGLPSNVTWCRVIEEDTCAPVTSTMRISSNQEKGNGSSHVLQFYSVYKNDSGVYKCSVTDHELAQTVRLIQLNVFDGHQTESFTRDTSKTWTTYFFIAVRIIIVIIVYSMIYCYLRQNTVPHQEATSTTTTQKIDSASRNISRITNKKYGKSSGHHQLDVDPPTVSFEMVCDNLDTCGDPAPDFLPEQVQILTEKELQDNEASTF